MAGQSTGSCQVGPNGRSSLVPRLYHISVLQAMESWAGPGNEVMVSVGNMDIKTILSIFSPDICTGTVDIHK